MLRVLIIMGMLVCAYEAQAQEVVNGAKDKAKAGAVDILAQKPNVLKVDSPVVKASTAAQVAVNQKDYGEAPLGLAWGINVKEVKLHGVTLRALDSKSFLGSYEATYLPKPIVEMPKTVLSFGNEDKLWRIVTYSEPAYDDDNAAKGLYIYKKYYKLLNQKYGNGQEFFKPKMNVIEKEAKDAQGRLEMQKVEVPSEIGDKSFLADVQADAVSLYSTFDGNKIGVSLTLRVDETGKSYIVIEYRNADIMQENYDATMKAL